MTLVQRRLIGFGVLVVGALVVLLATGLLEHRTNVVAEKAADDARLLRFAPDKVAKVTLVNANGTFSLVRTNGAWWMAEPLDVAADGNVVDGLVSALAELRRTRGVDVRDDLAMFGLEPPVASVTIESETGTESIAFGKKNAMNGELYAKVADVVMVEGAIDYQVSKTAFDLRDKRLVRVAPASLRRVDVTRADGSAYALERRGGSRLFVIAGGLSAEADAAQVDGVLGALTGLRAVKFATDRNATDDERRDYLKTPVLRAKLTAADEAHTLVLAKRADGWFAALEGEPSPILAVAGEAVVRKVDVAPASLRDLHVVTFDRAAVKQITVKRGDDSVTVKTDDKGVWQVVAANPSDGGAFPREADASRISGVLYTVYGLEAREVVKEDARDADAQALGFGAPTLVVTLAGEDGAALAVLEVTTDPQKRTLARAQGQSRIDAVSADALADISAKLANYLPGDAGGAH